ncbi:MAG: hypothetical protein ACOH12_06600 [Parvibaculaceae bacterium]
MAEHGVAERRRKRTWFVLLLVALILALLFLLCYCSDRRAAETLHPLDKGPVLALGDAVVTGFSGAARPDPAATLPTGKSADDMSFIKLDGPSVRILNPRSPDFVWNGKYWAMPKRRDISAGAVGQVFGVTLDQRAYPDIYLTATSVYGLNIVVPVTNGHIKRTRKGEPEAQWAAGQFGPDGGPGSIWKVDGRTGTVSKFADVVLDNTGTGPAGLGNIAYDAGHRQLFVSDLSSGMIHRFDLKGKDLGHFDHGKGVGVAFDASARVNIASRLFNTEQPATWGFTAPERRVWGVAVNDGRLYYAVAKGVTREGHGKESEDAGQIWSVGLTKTGDFARDARVEITLVSAGGDAPVSDIVFSKDGAMIVAERAVVGTTYDYKPLAATGTAHVWRFWRETPDDKDTPSAWYQAPEEYAVGFGDEHRASAGGVALGYGYHYDKDGKVALDFDDCETAIFFTGDNLRSFRKVDEDFVAEGDLSLSGLQVSPSRPVRGFNVPPAISYLTNYADEMTSEDLAGRVGDLTVYRLACDKPSCVGVAGSVRTLPPEKNRAVAILPPPPAGPPPSPPPCVGVGCVPPPVCVGADCPDPACVGPDCHHTECVGPDCTPDNPQQCMKIEGEAECDPDAGGWVYKLTTQDTAGIGLNMLTVLSTTPGVTVTNGPDITVVPPPGVISLAGTTPGQTVAIDVCGFDGVARAGGKPYDCCHATVNVTVPTEICEAPK